ncbi:MAG: MMPL family transporter [Candidatus Neomarinimicrobiota bacterium]|nr:MMPL family transporter [Candidatus Neomarinimicrobiota bacterium]
MNLKTLTKRIFLLDAHYPRSIIASIFLFTIFFLWKIPDLEIDPGLRSLVPADHKIVKNMELAEELFSSNEIVIIAVESEDLISKSTLIKFSFLHDSLENMPSVSRVASIYNQSYIVPDDGGFEIQNLLEKMPSDSIEISNLIETIHASDIIGNLVSADLNIMCFVAQITASTDFDEIEFRERLYRIVKNFEEPEKIYLASPIISSAESIDSVKRDMRTFTPIALGLMILLLILSFRSWTGTFLPLFVVGFSILWTFGLMAWLDISVPIIGGLIPIMLIAIANNYGIHIISHYYEFTKMDQSLSRTEILKRTMQRLGMPIFLAGITTVISFMSLMTHELSKVREIGLLVSFGIAVSFLLSLFLIPAILILVPRPTYLGKDNSLQFVNKFLVGWGKFFVRNRTPFLATLFVGMFFFSFGIRDITIDTVPDHFFPIDSKIRKASRVISKTFGGSTQLNILIEGDIYDPLSLEHIDKLMNHIKEKNKAVSSTYSIADVIKKMHYSFNNGNIDSLKIPSSRELIEQYMFLYSIAGEDNDFDLILNDTDDPDFTQCFVRIKKVRTVDLMALVDDTEDYIHSNYYDGQPIKPMLSGPAALLGAVSHLVIRGQIISLAIAAIIILIIMSIVFRSFIGGILASLPMSLAVLLIFGFLGNFGIPLNMTTSLLTCILVGCGVDYSVHFLWHLREHIREGGELDQAIANTMKVSGKGILFNGISVIVGFSVLMYSVFMPLKAFSVLIMASISFCLIGGMAILPAMVSLIDPKFIRK